MVNLIVIVVFYRNLILNILGIIENFFVLSIRRWDEVDGFVVRWKIGFLHIFFAERIFFVFVVYLVISISGIDKGKD